MLDAELNMELLVPVRDPQLLDKRIFVDDHECVEENSAVRISCLNNRLPSTLLPTHFEDTI